MSILSKTESEFYHLKQNAGGSRFPENYINELHGFYKANGGETQIGAGDLSGDRIKWNAKDYLQIKVLRSIGGEQIPYMIGMPSSGWGVDLSSPPIIKFSTPLALNELVYVSAPNRFQTTVRPEVESYPIQEWEVAAGGSQSTFTLNMLMPLSWKNGRRTNANYMLYVDGVLQRLNSPETTDGDYNENRIGDTGEFGSVTFNSAVGDALNAINVTLIRMGSYSNDDLPLATLTSQGDRITSLEKTITETVLLYDSKSSGTSSGTFTSGAWRTRDLNTLDDPLNHGFCTLTSNQFTLQPGTYEIDWQCPVYRVGYHKSRFYNTTDGVVVKSGGGGFTDTVGEHDAISIGSHIFSIATAKTYEIQNRCSHTFATHGFGYNVGVSFTVDEEIYTQVKIRKLE